MVCFLCGEVLDGRKAYDVKQGDTLRGAHGPCAVKHGYAEDCEGCKKPFPPNRLCTNERTRRRECSKCYELWRKGFTPPEEG